VVEVHNEALIEALAHPRFELIPIKDVEEQAAYLPRGATVTVTCSPARGIEHTLLHAEQLVLQGIHTVPHISARLVAGTTHLREILQRMDQLNLREIFVVGGDAKQPAGSFSGALDLLRAMAEIGHNLDQVGVAAYPEHHPLIDDETLRRALVDKQQYATYMVTQICFDPDTIVAWLADTRQRGIALPVYIGLPGVVDTVQLLRISMKIGVSTAARFASKHAGLAARLLKPGSYQPTELVERLAPSFGDPWYNIRGLHFNTFNQVRNTEQWRQQMLNSVSQAPHDYPGYKRLHHGRLTRE
jgi:methylenetetrahydrofolate reductase (NADPH)